MQMVSDKPQGCYAILHSMPKSKTYLDELLTINAGTHGVHQMPQLSPGVLLQGAAADMAKMPVIHAHRHPACPAVVL